MIEDGALWERRESLGEEQEYSFGEESGLRSTGCGGCEIGWLGFCGDWLFVWVGFIDIFGEWYWVLARDFFWGF